MFSKPNQDASATPSPSLAPTPPLSPPPLAAAPPSAAPPAAQPSRPTSHGADIPASVLGPDLNIRGGIEGRGEIQLQGRAWGDVKVERLVVGESAELEGSVVANVVEVRGRVAGSIEAHSVRLLASARVEGDITYETLQVEVGAQLDGRCTRGFSGTNSPSSGKPARETTPPMRTAATQEAAPVIA